MEDYLFAIKRTLTFLYTFFFYRKLGTKNAGNDEDQSGNINASNNSVVFSSTSSTPAVVISTLKPKVDPEDVTDTACIRKGEKINLVFAHTNLRESIHCGSYVITH